MTDIAWKEVKDKLSFEEGYVIAMFTDRVIVCKYPLNQEKEEFFNAAFEKYILDCRIFNKSEEHRWFRGDIGRKLRYRFANDEGKEFFDRSYYLDIDTARSKDLKGEVYATGGGRYFLPVDNIHDEKILIRNYIKYDDFGHARISDWRCVDFMEDQN